MEASHFFSPETMLLDQSAKSQQSQQQSEVDVKNYWDIGIFKFIKTLRKYIVPHKTKHLKACCTLL